MHTPCSLPAFFPDTDTDSGSLRPLFCNSSKNLGPLVAHASSIAVLFEEPQTMVGTNCKGHSNENKSTVKEEPWLENVLFRNTLISLKQAQCLLTAYETAPNAGLTCQTGGF